MIYAEDTYTTVNAWGNARPVIGDMNTIRAHNKTILIENTGALNIAELEIVGSLDNGVTYDVPLFYGTLAKSTLIIVTEDRVCTHIRINAKNFVADKPTTVISKGFAIAGG